MRSPSSHLPAGIDHEEERAHQCLVDDSLFEVIAHRLRAVLGHLDAASMDETVSGIRRHLDVLTGRIEAAKRVIEAVYETGPYDRECHARLHEITVNLTDRAETLAHRFEEAGGRSQILAAVDADLGELERVLDACTAATRIPG